MSKQNSSPNYWVNNVPNSIENSPIDGRIVQVFRSLKNCFFFLYPYFLQIIEENNVLDPSLPTYGFLVDWK